MDVLRERVNELASAVKITELRLARLLADLDSLGLGAASSAARQLDDGVPCSCPGGPSLSWVSGQRCVQCRHLVAP